MKYADSLRAKGMLLFLSLLLLLSFVSCRESTSYYPEDGRIAATVGDREFSVDMLSYFWQNTKKDYPQKSRDSIKDEVSRILKKNQAISMLSEQYRIELSADDLRTINEQIEALQKEKGDAYHDYLEAYGMTPYVYYEVQSFTLLWQRLYDYAMGEENGVISVSDAVLEADLPENFRRISYVLIKKDGACENPEKTAGEVYASAARGEDFNRLIEVYGEDSTMQSKVSTGYYYTIGQIDDAVARAVESISEGGISSPVETDYGFYVVKRLPLDMAYVNEHFEEMRTMCKARKFNEMIARESDKISVVYTELWDQLTAD